MVKGRTHQSGFVIMLLRKLDLVTSLYYGVILGWVTFSLELASLGIFLSPSRRIILWGRLADGKANLGFGVLSEEESIVLIVSIC